MSGKLIVAILSAVGIVILIWFVVQIDSQTIEYQAMPQTQTQPLTTTDQSRVRTYECAENTAVTLTLEAERGVYTLVTPAGESIMVREQAAHSGVRFENLDGNVVWQSTDEKAFLEELGVVTASECVHEPQPTNSTARPARNQLAGTSWEWLGVEYSDGESVIPDLPEVFILNFTNQTAMSALTDCNSVRGTYKLGEQQHISFSNLSSTRMFCEDSQEEDFQAALQEAERWRRVDDQLLLHLTDGAGTSTFMMTEVVVQ